MKNSSILFIVFVALLFQTVALAQPAINLFSTGEHSVYREEPKNTSPLLKGESLNFMGNRYFTFSTVVRVNQIETSRDKNSGVDEAGIHSPESARKFRETIEKNWPGARITWTFSWLALKDQRPNYLDIKKLVVSYHKKYGDEITFLPGGYFANMYNSREPHC